mmetsp:Transcript_29589/g.27022  ORF Transcript_29589/g.27022 Transcript_29589/m.27022 type:complete len:302 (-) Transcript_29589:579-1484(-)
MSLSSTFTAEVVTSLTTSVSEPTREETLLLVATVVITLTSTPKKADTSTSLTSESVAISTILRLLPALCLTAITIIMVPLIKLTVSLTSLMSEISIQPPRSNKSSLRVMPESARLRSIMTITGALASKSITSLPMAPNSRLVVSERQRVTFRKRNSNSKKANISSRFSVVPMAKSKESVCKPTLVDNSALVARKVSPSISVLPQAPTMTASRLVLVNTLSTSMLKAIPSPKSIIITTTSLNRLRNLSKSKKNSRILSSITRKTIMVRTPTSNTQSLDTLSNPMRPLESSVVTATSLMISMT